MPHYAGEFRTTRFFSCPKISVMRGPPVSKYAVAILDFWLVRFDDISSRAIMKCAEAWQARETGKNTRNLVTQIDRDKA